MRGLNGTTGVEKNLKQYPFIFRMWSIKYSTCWPVPITMALILSIKLQVIDVACIAQMKDEEVKGNEEIHQVALPKYISF